MIWLAVALALLDLLTVACRCGVTFERWVTPLDAELDLLHAASLN